VEESPERKSQIKAREVSEEEDDMVMLASTNHLEEPEI